CGPGRKNARDRLRRQELHRRQSHLCGDRPIATGGGYLGLSNRRRYDRLERASERGVETAKYPYLVDFGHSGGSKRNQQMLEEGKPDLVLAFPGGRGTADMVRRAQEAGIRGVCPKAWTWPARAVRLPRCGGGAVTEKAPA